MAHFIRDDEDPVFWISYRAAPNFARAILQPTRRTNIDLFLPDFDDLLTILRSGIPREYRDSRAVFIIQSLTDANISWARAGNFQPINDVTPQDIKEGLEKLVQSSVNNTEFKFGFAFPPSPRLLRLRQRISGSGITKVPQYVGAPHLQSWKQQVPWFLI